MKRNIYFLVEIFVIGSLLQICCGCEKDKVDLRLADTSVVWWMAPGTIAQKAGLYEKNGLKIKSFNVQTGLASKNAVLSGSADVGLIASTPLAMGAFSHDDLIILCSYLESPQLIALLTTGGDTMKYSKPELPIAVVKGTISELYLYNYLKKYYPDEIESLINNQLNVKPADVFAAMSNSAAKSASIWEPYASTIANQTNMKVNRAPDVYNHRIYIVTTPKVFQQKKEALRKFVKSFEMACDLIHKNPLQVQQILTEEFPLQRESMIALWDKVDFSIKYDYTNIQKLILLDANSMAELHQTPIDTETGECRTLNLSDIQYYFRNDFIPESNDSNR